MTGVGIGPLHSTDGTNGSVVGSNEFKSIMRQHAAGVAVITTHHRGPTGFCATSLSSVSLDPPMISFAVHRRSFSWHAWRSAALGIVHLLHDGQSDIARMFGRPDKAKFSDSVPWRWTPEQLPLLDDVLAWMVVEPNVRIIAGDHALVICKVLQVDVNPGRDPLVHVHGRFLG